MTSYISSLLDAVNDSILNTKTKAGKVHAHIFYGLVMHSFNKEDEAIEYGKHALKLALKVKDKMYEITAKGNLAYFLSEIAGNTDLEKKHNAQGEALKLIKEAFELLESEKKAAVGDEE